MNTTPHIYHSNIGNALTPPPPSLDECATYGYFAASPQEAGATGLPQHPSIPNCPLIDFY